MKNKDEQSQKEKKGLSGNQKILITLSCSMAVFLMAKPVATRLKQKADLIIANNLKLYELFAKIFS